MFSLPVTEGKCRNLNLGYQRHTGMPW